MYNVYHEKYNKTFHELNNEKYKTLHQLSSMINWRKTTFLLTACSDMSYDIIRDELEGIWF